MLRDENSECKISAITVHVQTKVWSELLISTIVTRCESIILRVLFVCHLSSDGLRTLARLGSNPGLEGNFLARFGLVGML